MRATLAAVGIPDTPLQTDPPRYLTQNDPPETTPLLLFDPPIPKPTPHAVPLTHNDPPATEQAALDRYAGTCPACPADPHNLAEHLLTEHPDVVNARLDALAAEREPAPEPDDDPQPIEDTPEPTMYAEVPTDRVGQPIGEYNDPRQCDDCGTVMSKGYAKVFATEWGQLKCPECQPRSERYTNDPTYGDDSHSDPAVVLGAKNAQSAANDAPTWTRGG